MPETNRITFLFRSYQLLLFNGFKYRPFTFVKIHYDYGKTGTNYEYFAFMLFLI